MAKILLVEDDNNLREIYEQRLTAEGYIIVSAHDGEEALVVAKNEKPDLIISDVMMPNISGFEMLDILRNTEGMKDTKVIMLTALGQAEDQQRADKLGADKYLVKSQVTLEDIVKVSEELLTGKTASNEVMAASETDQMSAEPAAAAPAMAVSTHPDDTQSPVSTEPVMASTPETDQMSAEPVAAAPAMAVSTHPDDTQSPVSTEPVMASTPETDQMSAEPAQQAPVSMPVEPSVSPSIVAQAMESTLQDDRKIDDNIMNDAVNQLTEATNTQTAQMTQVASQEAVGQLEPDLNLPIAAPKEPIINEINNDAEPVAEETGQVEDQIKQFENEPAETSTENTPSTAEPAMAVSTHPDDTQSPVSTEPVMASTPETDQMSAEPAQQAPVSVPVEPIQASEVSMSEDEQAKAAMAEMNSMPGKKVIEPISPIESKPDINELLAKEEAKESMSTPELSSEPIKVTVNTQTNANTNQPIDPNSIAL